MALSDRSEEHTSELQSPCNLVCRLLLEKKKTNKNTRASRELATAAYRIGTPLPETLDVPRSPHAVHPDADRLLDRLCCFFFFFNDTATTEIYPLSLHDALPI